MAPRILACLTLLAVLACLCAAAEEPGDILLADFEGTDYGDWQATGDAFGTGPARGTLPNQQPVTGFLGKGLVNTYRDGDKSTGTLTSPDFTIQRRYVNFLIGGGNHPGKTCVNLLVGGKVVRTATGTASTPADDEHLSWYTWDVGDLKGQTARIQIVDDDTGGWGHVNVDHILQSDQRKMTQYANDALTRAMSSVQGATARVQNDPNRPVYHVLPPALWNNDPDGPIFHNGFYHLFYQHNPYGDRWEHMHWGHVRSKDLVHWEHLPIALWPSQELGENHVFSGCAAVTKKGEVLLLYTSIGNRLPEQWAAVAEDDDLVRWRKHKANPVLTEKLHGDVKVHEWRDPFVFAHEGRQYLVAGGNLNGSKGGQAVVNVYRAESDELTEWRYLGVLFQHPDAGVRNIECPNFFKLGERWVLIVSQGRPVQFFTGDLDPTTMRFTARTRGVMDHGDYYAPNCLADDRGRRVLWGWVTGFKGGQGWNGCLTLPRLLTLHADGTLGQAPPPELQQLRGEAAKLADVALADSAKVLEQVQGDALEIMAEFEPGDAKSFGLRVRRAADGSRAVTIRYDGRELDLAGTKVPLPLREGEKTLRLHVFVDHSVLEVYAGDRECVTRVVYPEAKDVGVEVFASGGRATLRTLQAWRLKTIW
jgi:sucrose-6-phosphate hydrolase SacC (GH32 family)